jgi:hypothetical protein
MRRFIALVILGCFLSSVVDTRALAADYELSYAQCLQESSQALRQHHYLKAIEYLKLAHQKAPALQYPLEKIKAIQQLIRNNRPKLSNASPSLNRYQKFSRLGKESFEKGDFKLASYYFHLSYLMLEDNKKAGEYINLLKRAQEGKIRGDYPARQLDTRPVVSIKPNTSAAITTFVENTHRNSSKEISKQSLHWIKFYPLMICFGSLNPRRFYRLIRDHF